MNKTIFLKMLCVGLSSLALTTGAQQISNSPLLVPLDFHNFGAAEVPWFQPAVTVLPDGSWLATMQSLMGSDHYGGPLFSITKDQGRTWSPTAEIKCFRTEPFEDTQYEMGVVDVRPFTSPNDGTVFAFGGTTYYSPSGLNAVWVKGDKPKLPPMVGVYATWRPDTGWSERKILPLPGVQGSYRAQCTQAVFVENGELLVPIYLERGRIDYYGYDFERFGSVVARYRQVGEELEFVSMSQYFDHGVERGLDEPSVIRLPEGGFALTFRAEDGRGYSSWSEDDVSWSDKVPWSWEDGTPLTMTSTQQHWMRVGAKVYLVYTRDAGTNSGVFRCRAPLFMAEAIPSRGVLLRETEKVVFPRQLIDGEEALYGNFHCAQLTEETVLITDAAAVFNGNSGPKCRLMVTLVVP